MSFMSSLAANPSSSGIYGQSGQQDDILGIVNQLKDREWRDFQNKANFMSDLSIKQDRMRRLFDTEGQQEQQPQQPMNTVMGRDPNEMTGYQKGELGIRQQQLGQEQQKIAQAGRLGQERINIQSEQQDLNQQKSDQINATKQADMQRKISESDKKIALAQQALEQRTDNAEAQLQARRDLAAATEERHKLELENKQHQFDTVSEKDKQQIKIMEERLKQSGHTVETKKDAEGNEVTTDTKKGSAAKKIKVTAPDGTVGYIPEDMLDDWNSQYGEQ